MMWYLWQWFDKAVLGMALLRLLSGSIEILAALIMLKVNEVGKALVVNSMLAMVGPLILLTTTAIGLVGVAHRLSFDKILLVFLGVLLILMGVRK